MTTKTHIPEQAQSYLNADEQLSSAGIRFNCVVGTSGHALFPVLDADDRNFQVIVVNAQLPAEYLFYGRPFRAFVTRWHERPVQMELVHSGLDPHARHSAAHETLELIGASPVVDEPPAEVDGPKHEAWTPEEDVLSHPDVKQAIEDGVDAYERWKQSL